jgi:hypothetical protein
MPTVIPCKQRIGKAIALKTEGAAPLSILFNGAVLSDIGLATSMSISQNISAQFQQTLEEHIYVTPFGDNPGKIVINFVNVEKCGEEGVEKDILTYYLQHRLRPVSMSNIISSGGAINVGPVIVSVGANAFYGYIVGVDYQADTASDMVVRGALTLIAWPVQ